MKKQHFHLIICFSFFIFCILQTACGLTPQEQRERFIEQCKSYLGTPYKYGGTTKKGMDCSGFIFTSAKESLGLNLPRRSEDLYNSLEHIEKGDLQPGDLIFFKATDRINHAAVYLGDNTFIHSASDGPKTGVIISNLDESYWKQTYAGCAQLLPKMSEQELASLLKGEKKTADENPEPEKAKTEEIQVAKTAEKTNAQANTPKEAVETVPDSPVVMKENKTGGGGTKALRIEPRQENENMEEVAHAQSTPKAEEQTAPVSLKKAETAAVLEEDDDEETFTAVVFEKYSEKIEESAAEQNALPVEQAQVSEPVLTEKAEKSAKTAAAETEPAKVKLADALPIPEAGQKTASAENAEKSADIDVTVNAAPAQTAQNIQNVQSAQTAPAEEPVQMARTAAPVQNTQESEKVSYALPVAEPVSMEKIEEPSQPVQTAQASKTVQAAPVPAANNAAGTVNSHAPQQTVVAQPQLNVTISVEGFIY